MSKKVPIILFVLAPMLLVGCGGGKKSSSGSQSGSSSSSIVDDGVSIYTVTLNACTGDKKDNQTISGRAGTSQTLPSITREGYIFAGWSNRYDKNTGMGAKTYMVSNNYTIDAKNQVLYAVYRKSSIDDKTAQAELEKWIEVSQPNHFYYHYYRFDNQPSSYADWDVWAWSYYPEAGEGAKFDWVGRTQSEDKMSATGDAILDQYAGAYIDIDLTKTYYGGWDNVNEKILSTPVSYATSTQLGLQIVKSSTRKSASGFWTNDGSNLYINLEDYAVPVTGGTAYHVFVVQDNVQDPSATPKGEADPFDGDKGENTTYGNNQYNNVKWSSSPALTKTSKDFSELGVGYQIMVSSFADSDGDGFGDIYGITQKLDYLEALGVKALWLTPIQLSDSYHGYDITDYEKVDPKFGSKVSPAAKIAGTVDSDTALADYKELIDLAHARGMKVVMDLVLNHTSTSNTWFVRSANLDEHFRGYYQWGNHNTQSSVIREDNNWYPYGSHPYSYYAKFGSSMPELNFSYVDTRVAVEEMSIYWARDIGVDGFRLDAVKHIYMTNEVSSTSGDTIIRDNTSKEDYSSDLTKNLHFFKELKSIVTKCSQKDVFFVGENFDGHAYHVAPYYQAFDSMFDFYTYFNLTSAAATGRKNTTSAYGTAAGFMHNTSVYTISADNDPDSGVVDGHGDMKAADNSAWNFPAVYATYNKYRNDTSLPGVFTSNHDIARTINRIAGTGDAHGLQAQGNVTTSNYADYEKSAICVKLAEIMFPGLTWVYYGDEIGMTGNFPKGSDADSAYADLWYRQPMKWSSDGKKGDGNGTTDYYVTGSSMRVEQDEVNKSSVVKPALEQMKDANSEFSLMSKFIKLKAGNDEVGKALRTGSINATYFMSGDLAANTLCFTRKSGSTTVKVAVNFNNQEMSAYDLSGTVLASYNGATASKLPAYSVIVVKA